MVFKTLRTEILVVGAGIAGIRASVESQKYNDTLLVTHNNLAQTGSTFNGVNHGWGFQTTDNQKEIEEYYKEILNVSEKTVDKKLAKILASESFKLINEFTDIGLDIHISNMIGDFSQKPRAYGVLDRDNIRNSFIDYVSENKIKVMENSNIIDLIINDGVCIGAYIVKNNKIYKIIAKSVILTTGGYTNNYKYNLNSKEICGVGHGIVLESGGRLTNIEFNQFMLGLSSPKKLLFPENLLKYCNIPEIFKKNYLPKHIDLDLIINERESHGPYTTNKKYSKYFDIGLYNYSIDNNKGLTINLSKEINNRYVNWYKKNDFDIVNENFEIIPCASVSNGGVIVNQKCETDIKGLFVAGELMGGPHGANRLGGNMMSAGMVFGKLSGYYASKYIKNEFKPSFLREMNSVNNSKILSLNNMKKNNLNKINKLEIKSLNNNIRKIMWKNVSIVKEKNKLIESFDRLTDIQNKLMMYSWCDEIVPMVNLYYKLITSKAIVFLSLKRKETRGPHYRKDIPNKNKQYSKLLGVKKQNNKFILDE